MYESIFMGVQKKMKYWSKMPSRWVIDGGLKKFRYSSNNQNQMNAANIAALMIFLIMHGSCCLNIMNSLEVLDYLVFH